jgi:ferritin
MTPKKKALELKESFNDALTTKDCALVAVKEMLKVAWFLADEEIYNFLLEVKEELENL